MITHPVSPTSRWAVLQISTGTIISRNKPWPVADGGPIPGLDPDYVYLQQITDAQPDYDSRIYLLESTETADADANELRVSWETVKRTVGDIAINAQNVEAAENLKHYTDLERDKLLMLGLGVLFRLQANQNLTNPEQALKQRIVGIATKLWKNDASLKAKLVAIAAGQTPDLDAGWEPG